MNDQKKNTFNDIGIASELDWPRIRKLLCIGFIAACMVLVGDVLLGWGKADESLTGLDQYFSRYLTVSDSHIFWSAILGLIGIPLESLCYFGVYRLIASRSRRYAHLYRSGLLGMLAFGGFTHVVCCATIYHFNAIYRLAPASATAEATKFALYYLLPVMAIFFPFFLLAAVIQILAFAKGLTPYPRWCAVFSIISGVAVIVVMKFVGNHPVAYALSTGWISLGGMWTFGGLLVMVKHVSCGGNNHK